MAFLINAVLCIKLSDPCGDSREKSVFIEMATEQRFKCLPLLIPLRLKHLESGTTDADIGNDTLMDVVSDIFGGTVLFGNDTGPSDMKFAVFVRTQGERNAGLQMCILPQ